MIYQVPEMFVGLFDCENVGGEACLRRQTSAFPVMATLMGFEFNEKFKHGQY